MTISSMPNLHFSITTRTFYCCMGMFLVHNTILMVEVSNFDICRNIFVFHPEIDNLTRWIEMSFEIMLASIHTVECTIIWAQTTYIVAAHCLIDSRHDTCERLLQSLKSNYSFRYSSIKYYLQINQERPRFRNYNSIFI